MESSIELISLKCSSCGAPIEDFHGQSEAKCQYCNNVTRILRPIRVVANSSKFGEAEINRLNNLLAIMEKSMVAGNYREAYDYCNKALEIDPNSSTLWENKAICSFWLSSIKGIINSDAQEIVTYLNAAKQADPGSPTYNTTASSIASNIFWYIKYVYSKKSFDASSDGKTYDRWSTKSIDDIINYLNLMEICFSISPTKLYLATAVSELTGSGRVSEWIKAEKNKDEIILSNGEWLKKHNYDAVRKREVYINKIKQIEPGYQPPQFDIPKTNYTLLYVVLAAVGIFIFWLFTNNKDASTNTSGNSSSTITSNSPKGVVKSSNGLNIRSDASSTATILTSAPYNDFVTIIDTAGPSETISGVTANWIKVQYNGTTGWAWGGLIGRQ